MLGAIVPHGDEVFYFKIVGDNSLVGGVAEEVRAWVQSVTFEAGEPKLQAPEGWLLRMGGTNEFDVAKLDLPVGEPPLELKITRLRKNGPWSVVVASNVNRWRGQMGLPTSEALYAEGVPLIANAESQTDTANDEPAIWVDLLGEFGAGSMSPGMATSGGFGAGFDVPFSPGAAMPSGGAMPPNPAAATTLSDLVKFTVPEGWKPGKMSSMRLAAFQVGENNRTAELTVIPATGDVLANVERWLGQVYPEGAPEGELDRVIQAGQDVTVDGRMGKRFFVKGSGDVPVAIDGTVVPQEDGASLFIKMTGNAEVVAGESERIGQFLESLKVNL